MYDTLLSETANGLNSTFRLVLLIYCFKSSHNNSTTYKNTKRANEVKNK